MTKKQTHKSRYSITTKNEKSVISDSDKALLLNQWQTCVEMANSVSQRRDTMNNFFVTINLAIVATISLTWDLKSIILAFVGLVLCIVWLLFIRNYKLLNTEKFKVINKIEKQLPAKPFFDEWEILKNNKKYKDTTSLENIIPITFIVLFIVSVGLIIRFKYINGGIF